MRIDRALYLTVFLVCIVGLNVFIERLEFNRHSILSGELWRIWSGHLVHSNFKHLALNYIAFVVLYITLLSRVSVTQLVLVSVVFSLMISAAFLLTVPELQWYNGLSGLLHCLMAFYLVLSAIWDNKLYWIIFALLWIKIANETYWALISVERQIFGIFVITEAHLIGVIVGSASALSLVLTRCKRADLKPV